MSQKWSETDIFVVQAPTAFGKTALSKTLMNALRSVSAITPTNQLVTQFREEFSDTPTLARLDSYHCEEWKRPCPVTRGKLLGFCRGGVCPASADLSTAKHRKGPGIYNYHTYLAHKLYRDILVVDEAHNLIPVIRDRLGLTIWQHDYKYPRNMYSPEQIRAWIGTLSPQKQRHQKIQLLRESVQYQVPRYIVQRTTELFNGKGTQRGRPEQRDCLRLLPVDISDTPPLFWPKGEVSKVILLSATIGPKDIEALGISRGRRVSYIKCKSPIPATQRPIVALCTVTVNRGNMEQAADQLAAEIDRLAQKHPGEKGVVHATYQLARLLRSRVGSSPDTQNRYLFHDSASKQDVYRAFRESPPADGAILVASGMYEGVDLPDDLGRWQVLAKIPWLNLGNPAVAHQAKLDPEHYIWETMKTTIQACGRICRTPEDYGVTYCLDASFLRLLRDGDSMIPDWFREAIVYV